VEIAWRWSLIWAETCRVCSENENKISCTVVASDDFTCNSFDSTRNRMHNPTIKICNVVWFNTSLLTFRSYISPPSSVSLPFGPEERGDTFSRNACGRILNYIAMQPIGSCSLPTSYLHWCERWSHAIYVATFWKPWRHMAHLRNGHACHGQTGILRPFSLLHTDLRS
jgi:hypothetical protein